MSKKILVIDDDQTTARLIKSALEPHGYAVTTAGDGDQGLEFLKAELPDLVILDIQMPKMNGYAFIVEMKKLGPDFKNIPVVVLTAKEGMADIFKMEGVKEYIVKPLDGTYVLALVKKYA